VRIAFATCARVRELTEDDRLAVDELQRRGAEADPAVWDDPAVPWNEYDRIVIRSCWDYHLRLAEFDGWLSRLEGHGMSVWNPPSLVRANADKSYLRSLDSAGVPVLPTAWLSHGARVDLGRLLDDRGWSRAIVKPAVSATAHRTWMTSSQTVGADQARLEALLVDGDALVQEYAPEIRASGEWSFVFLGGDYSHAVLKTPAQGDFRVQAEFGGSVRVVPPPTALLDQARRIAGGIPAPWAYARVDGLDREGTLILMELELIEPQLFLGCEPAAPSRFADAILAAGS
jgi:glutathione synthase/RimK-type ligase-like ATP-grasp enzyme